MGRNHMDGASPNGVWFSVRWCCGGAGAGAVGVEGGWPGAQLGAIVQHLAHQRQYGRSCP
eukprot:1288048-Prymnesium_polylepis.2